MDTKKIKEKVTDELIIDFTFSALVSYLWIPVSVAFIITPLHESLHAFGAIIQGGSVKSITFLNIGNWVKQYFMPAAPAGPLGVTTASLPAHGLFGINPGLLYYFMPYIVMFPLSLILLAGDGIGISDYWRLLGAPMFYTTFVAFWSDYALYMGSKNVWLPFPSEVFQVFYLTVILIGITTVTWFTFLRNEKVFQ